MSTTNIKVMLINNRKQMYEQEYSVSSSAAAVHKCIDGYITDILGFNDKFKVDAALWASIKDTLALGEKIKLVNGLCKRPRYGITKVVCGYETIYSSDDGIEPPEEDPEDDADPLPAKYNYKLTYHANYQGAPVSSIDDTESITDSSEESVTFTIDSSHFTRSGYTFVGWAITTDGEATHRPGVKVALYKDNPTLDLYAIWTEAETETYITDISIYSLPSKTTYVVSDPFDSTGLILAARYSDASIRQIDHGFSCTGFDSVTAGTKTITVTYAGFSVTFTVVVNVAAGSCGDGLFWTLDDGGALNITGTGDIYSFESDCAPWYTHKDLITTVVLTSGISSIGHSAFRDCTNLAAIYISYSTTSIDEYAFYNCTNLVNVYYTGTEDQWNNISIGERGNEPLINATLHYNSSLTEHMLATNIITNNDTFTVAAIGTGTLKAYVGTECVSTVALDDVDSKTITVSSNGDPCYLAIDGEISELDLSNNSINSITFENDEKLARLKIHNNNLSDLDISKLKNLKYLHIYGNPIVDDYLIDENKYSNLKAVLDKLPSRTDKSLGSVVLYPWYGLETLIYKADGNHYKTPLCDFAEAPTASTEKVAAGTLCKYPRRLRFVSPENEAAYSETQCEYGVSARATAGEYYTDEPITEVFYNSDDQEDPHRSLMFVRNGIEYTDEDAAGSILYALVEGYDIEDPTKNSDKSAWNLKYVTYDINGLEVEHVLTKYNKLRKLLEKDTTTAKNWFFGSAIQDTADYKYCQHYFIEAGVQDVWETTQKGFGLTWGLHDNISSCQPDWNHKNIVRYTNFFGNTLDAKINTDLGAPTVTDSRHTQGLLKQINLADPSDIRWGSDGNYSWGHGDHIISYLTSTGVQQLKYNGTTYKDFLYGTCPNIAIYVLDHASAYYGYSNVFNSDSTAMYITCDTFDNIEPTDLNRWYIYRIPTGNENEYNTLTTQLVMDQDGNYQKDDNGKYICESIITNNVVITPEDELTMYALTTDDHGVISACEDYFDISFKDMFEHCDASSLSWSMSGTSDYLHYLFGRFGERRYVTQSAGNHGDNHPATTDTINGTRSPSSPYGDFSDLSNKKYHSTAFITGAATKALNAADFSESSPDVGCYNFVFSDYMTSFGYGIKGYDNTLGLLSHINGTSMSSPNACGIMLLMMNLYKVINPQYADEPEYTSSDKQTSNLKYDSNNLLSGGYGKFSPFMDYVKNNWMLRPANLMTHQIGLGIPAFTAEKSTINLSSFNSDIPTSLNVTSGVVTDIAGIRDNQKVTLACHLKDVNAKVTTSARSLPMCTNAAIINVDGQPSKIIGLRAGTHTVYLCDNNPAYGDMVSPFESNNNWVYPNGFDTYQNTYNYYPVDLVVADNSELSAIPGYLSLTKTNKANISLPDNKSKKFTIQLKIKFNSDSLCDLSEPTVSGGFVEYYFINIGQSILKIVSKLSNNNEVLDSGNGANIQYLSRILNSTSTITKYRLTLPNTLTTFNHYDYYTDTHSTNQSVYKSENSDITASESHVLTLSSNGNNIYVYLDGACIVADDSFNAIENLNDIKVFSKLLCPQTEQYLLNHLNENILAYDRALSEEEIFKNVAYLLSTPEEN